MAQRQIRGGLSAILRNRRRGAKLDWSVSRLLQRTTTSFEPRRPHPGSSLLRSSSAPRGGLTPAEAPLIDAEFLYRQPGPVQCMPSGARNYDSPSYSLRHSRMVPFVGRRRKFAKPASVVPGKLTQVPEPPFVCDISNVH